MRVPERMSYRRAGLVFAIILALAVSAADLFGAEYAGPVLRKVRLELGGVSVFADSLRVHMGERPSGEFGAVVVDARGLLLRLPPSDGRRELDKLLPILDSCPRITIDGGSIFFGEPISFLSSEKLSFHKLDIRPSSGGVSVEAEDLDLGNLRIASVFAELEPGEDAVLAASMRGGLMGGGFAAEGNLDLASGNLDFSGDLHDVMLGEIPGISSDYMSGTVGMVFELSGNPGVPFSMEGRAQLRIEDGRMEGVPAMPGLAPVVLKPQYETEPFREGKAEIALRGGVLTTENARLSNGELSLSATGTIGIDGRLDLVISRFYSREYMTARPARLEMLGHFLKICDYFIIQHRLTGTLENPSYELIPLPLITRIPLTVKRFLQVLLPMQSGEIP